MSVDTLVWIWLGGIPVVFILHALWARLRDKTPDKSDFFMALAYSILWPGAYLFYWFLLLYFWAMKQVAEGACWIWNKVALRQ